MALHRRTLLLHKRIIKPILFANYSLLFEDTDQYNEEPVLLHAYLILALDEDIQRFRADLLRVVEANVTVNGYGIRRPISQFIGQKHKLEGAWLDL